VILETVMTVTTLICTVSFEFPRSSVIIIHNQCLNTELTSPVYFGDGTIYPRLSDQQMDISTAMEIKLKIYTFQHEFEGALLYKLQKHRHDQHNTDKLATSTDKNEIKYVYMLVAWKIKGKPFVHVVLVEHTREFIWSEDNLKQLYDKNCDRLKKYSNNTNISDTWLIDDKTTLKTTFKVISWRWSFHLSMSISEEERNEDAMRPLCVDPKR
jgi:hypothetical protein